MKKLIVLLGLAIVVLTGCSGISKEEYSALQSQNIGLKAQNDDLTSQIESLSTENEQLKAQIKTQSELHMSKIFELNNKSGDSLIKTISVQQEGHKVNNVVVLELGKHIFNVSFKVNYLNSNGDIIGTTDVIYSMPNEEIGLATHQYVCELGLTQFDTINSIEIQWINAG